MYVIYILHISAYIHIRMQIIKNDHKMKRILYTSVDPKQNAPTLNTHIVRSKDTK